MPKVSTPIDGDTLSEVKRLKLTSSGITNTAINESAKQASAKQWKEENREALGEYNQFIQQSGSFGEKHGVMLGNEPV